MVNGVRQKTTIKIVFSSGFIVLFSDDVCSRADEIFTFSSLYVLVVMSYHAQVVACSCG
jgi:hypothetical protein